MDAHEQITGDLLLCCTPERGVRPVRHRRRREPIAGVRLVERPVRLRDFDIIDPQERVVARGTGHPERSRAMLVLGPDGERLLELRLWFWRRGSTVLIPEELTVRAGYGLRNFTVTDQRRDLVMTVTDTRMRIDTGRTAQPGDYRIRLWQPTLTLAQSVALAQLLWAQSAIAQDVAGGV